METIEDCYQQIPKWREKFKEIYFKNNRGSVWEGEDFYFKPMFEAICKKFVSRYIIEEPFSMGGSSLVFKVHERFSETDRILKFSRPVSDEKNIAKALRDEGLKLRNLRYPYIIDLFEVGSIDYMTGRTMGFTITEFAEGGDWQNKVKSDLEKNHSCKKILKNFIHILYDAVRGLEFIHENKFIHMDVKANNIFLTNTGTAKIADFGFTKFLGETENINTTTVGFTKQYAHPDLLNYKPTGSSENRLTAKLRYNQLKQSWDIFALGQSILELLEQIEQKFQDESKQLPLFQYLHLMACRMLDGHNSEKGKFYTELALGLPRSVLEEIKYEKVEEIRKDIEKELGIFTLEKEIPELNIFSRETIHGSEWKPTILTKRLRELLSHPLISRLARVSQLGLIRFLYPTASHPRFDHLLGTFSNTCAYITALYHDQNPLFRQILNKNDLQTIMLTSLLHDLGQYPLAHDLEDVHNKFDHVKYSKKLLMDPTKDEQGRTLQQLIGSADGWDTLVIEVEKILRASEIKDYSDVVDQPTVRTKLLSTIISGPIDVDKTDYLMRDSRECRLYYGQAIDFDRLMQTITIDYSNNEFQLAVYHKGRACAESVSLTRYLMFASVFWHHTSRAYKTMLQYSVTNILENFEPSYTEKKFWEDFEKFLVKIEYKSKKKPNLLTEIESVGAHQNIAETDLSILNFFYDRSNPKSKTLLKMLASRHLFKRLASLDYSVENIRKIKESPWENFQKFANKWDRKLQLSKNLQKRLRVEVRKRAKEISSITLNELNMSKFDQLMEDDHFSILIDIPPIKDIEQPLNYVKEMREERYHDIPSEKMSQLSVAWMGAIQDLFKSICTVRIFCHPGVRNQIRASLTYDTIETMAREELGKIPE